VALIVARASGAQAPQSLTVRADNDAFNFWHTPGKRPDEEYTSGVFVRYDGGAVPWWARGMSRQLDACATRSAACRTRSLELGQDLFTPRRTWDSVTAPPGSRPNAAWLYLGESARILRLRRADEFTVTIGVTGPPALGEFTQRIAHDVIPASHRPMDWSNQIAFEPGIVLGYQQTRRVALGTAFDLLPRFRAEAGNIATNAEAGIRLRSGWHLQHPWLPVSSDRVEVAFSAGASARAVARDLFLDGSTFSSGPRVGHEPLVYGADWGLTIRYRSLGVNAGAVTESRTYSTGPAMHTWSTLSVTLVRTR